MVVAAVAYKGAAAEVKVGGGDVAEAAAAVSWWRRRNKGWRASHRFSIAWIRSLGSQCVQANLRNLAPGPHLFLLWRCTTGAHQPCLGCAHRSERDQGPNSVIGPSRMRSTLT